MRSLVLRDEPDQADNRATRVSKEIQGALREKLSALSVWQDMAVYGDALVIQKGKRARPVGIRKDVNVRAGYNTETGLSHLQQPAIVVDDDATILQISTEGAFAR